MVPSIFQAIVLGLVQGLTEFIPVSSSAHLQLIPQIFGWSDISTSFILFLHFGTLLALLAYFRQLIWRYIKVLVNWAKSKGQLHSKEDKRDFAIIIRVALATIPAGVLGLIFDKAIEHFYDANGSAIPTYLTILGLALFGVVFLFADKFFTGKKTDLEKLSFKRVLIVGISQALAFVRGVSRSGITLISGQSVGLTRVEAAEFSFLISIPVIAGTSLLDFYNLIKEPIETIKAEIVPDIVGILVAFIFGYLAIRFLLNYLKHKGLALFGWYRIIFAILSLILLV